MAEPDDELARHVRLMRQVGVDEQTIEEHLRKHAPAGDDGHATGAEEAAGEEAGSDCNECEPRCSQDGASDTDQDTADETPLPDEDPPPRGAKGDRKAPPIDADQDAPRARAATWDERAEMAVLGAMLVNDEAPAVVGEILEAGAAEFGLPKHVTIYAAMLAVDGRGDPVAVGTVVDELKRRHKLDDVGGDAYVGTLVGCVMTATMVAADAKIVHDHYICRELIKAGHAIMSLGYERRDVGDQLLDQSEALVFAIAQGRRADDRLDMADGIAQLIHEIRHPEEAPAQRRTATGFVFIDEPTGGGFGAGDLIVVGARPGIGKTSLATNIAWRVAQRGGRVLIFSLEMSRGEVRDRLAQCAARIDWKDLRARRVTPEQLGVLEKVDEQLRSGGIVVRDAANVTGRHLLSVARREAMKKPLSLIVLDYIQLMAGEGKGDNRNQELGVVSRQLKQLARELGAPVLELSQLTRGSAARQNKEPQLHELRDSGTIEQDADMVIFAWLSPEDAGAAADKKNEAYSVNVNIAKHRSGPLDSGRLLFHRFQTRFEETGH